MSYRPVPDKGTLGVPKDSPEYPARLRVRRIRDGLVAMGETVELLKAAYDLRDWETLGYPDWEKYLSAEFGTAAFGRLTRPQRKELVAELTGTMSTRAIAVVLGVGTGTVHRDLTAGVPNGTAEPKPKALPGAKAKVTGLDGKQHPAKKHHAPRPCGNCGTEYQARLSVRWCSPECREQVWAKEAAARRPVVQGEVAAEAVKALRALAGMLEHIIPEEARQLKDRMDGLAGAWQQVQEAFAKACGEEA